MKKPNWIARSIVPSATVVLNKWVCNQCDKGPHYQLKPLSEEAENICKGVKS